MKKIRLFHAVFVNHSIQLLTAYLRVTVGPEVSPRQHAAQD